VVSLSVWDWRWAVDAGRSVQVVSIPTGFGVIDAVRKVLLADNVQYRGEGRRRSNS